MGQLEKYGLYVLCLVIFLILGVAIWGGDDPAHAAGPGRQVALDGETSGAPPAEGGQPAEPGGEMGLDEEEGVQDLNSLLRREPPPVVNDGGADDRSGGSGNDADDSDVPAPTPEPAPKLSTYTVKKNDTFEKIAQRVLGDKSLHPEIQRLNPRVDPMLMQIGTELVLPAANAEKRGWRMERVKRGDSFARIAQRLFDSEKYVADIMKLNPDLDHMRLKPGTEIKVPLLR